LINKGKEFLEKTSEAATEISEGNKVIFTSEGPGDGTVLMLSIESASPTIYPQEIRRGGTYGNEGIE
jgi:hypothetical protein